MEYIQGNKVRDILEQNLEICKTIGSHIAEMHNNGIIHGDLTTSNMIFNGNDIFLIDFGLGFFSEKVEDMAVDLHLLKRALDSRHYTICEKAFLLVMKGYKEKSNNYDEVIKRLEIVESRGRNKNKY